MHQSIDRSCLRNWVAGFGAATVTFAVPHFVDDFLYGMPAEFGLSEPEAQVLGGLFFGAIATVLVLAGRGSRAGMAGSVVVGLLLAAAVILKHVGPILRPGPYWGGALSELSILGLGASSLAWAITSLVALLSDRSSGPRCDRGDGEFDS
jgi:fucose permease